MALLDPSVMEQAATSANPELVAKAYALLEHNGLPPTGPECGRAAAAAMAGVLLVNTLAQTAVRSGALGPGAGAAIESLCSRAVDTFAAVVVAES